ncbi:biofilm-associated protein [Nitrosopumilus sp.]|nr:biofilm-associated protein [Nitrosopumilus sp.]
MNKSINREMSISIIILFSTSLILIPLEVYADEVNVASIGLDETAIITATNNSDNEIKTFRVWLGDEFNFKSFKTEKGWTGEKNQQGVIIFTSSETVKLNELVKFGLKTDKINPIINWKALDQENKIIDTGIIKVSKLSKVNQNSNIELDQRYNNNGISIFSESTFRVIPDKPNPGSTIRITGDQFAESQKFDFYINTKKIGDFVTDGNGNFVTTMQIPDMEGKEKLDFKIIGYDGIERKISSELGENENRILKHENIKLEIKEIPQVVYQGELIKMEGKGTPGSSVVIKIINSNEILTGIKIVKVAETGIWKLLEPINIPLDAVFGENTIIISDTSSNKENQISKKWNVETNKMITINPEKIKFDPGELIIFTGTAIPNSPLELILQNNLGDEMSSDIIQVADSGIINFEYQTTENEDIEGTWTLIATQENNKEFIYVGYDVVPTIPVNIKFDKSSYKNIEKPIISLAGKPSEKISMIIITPSGNVVGSTINIELKADGKAEHMLDLSGYLSGIYTAVIKKGGTQSSENFSVGLIAGSGAIEANITQTEYEQGERILLLGNTANGNSLMYVDLIDPNGKKIKSLEMASNSERMFSEERLKIPEKGETGFWKIFIKSGSNTNTIEFEVLTKNQEGLNMKIPEKVATGELFKMDIVTSHKTSIIIMISDMDGNEVQQLTCNTTKEFKCETFWSIPKDTIPGTYEIKAYDAINSTEDTFEIIMK